MMMTMIVMIMMMMTNRMMMMMMMTTTTITIIALKGAIQDLLQSPHCAANCLQHVRSNGMSGTVYKSRVTHRALIKCNMLCATWYEGTAQLLSLTELKYPEKTTDDELQKRPHTKVRKFKPQARLEPAL